MSSCLIEAAQTALRQPLRWRSWDPSSCGTLHGPSLNGNQSTEGTMVESIQDSETIELKASSVRVKKGGKCCIMLFLQPTPKPKLICTILYGFR